MIDYIIANKNGAYITREKITEIRKNGIKVYFTFTVDEWNNRKLKTKNAKKSLFLMDLVDCYGRDYNVLSRIGS